jgi:PAS domain S-box-containing protein
MTVLRPRVAPNATAFSSRVSTLDEVWQSLNRRALWIAAILGPPSVVTYAIALQLTGQPGFAVLVFTGTGVSASAAWSLHRGRNSVEAVLVFGSIGVVAGATAATPLIRGVLWTALVVFAVAGALVLPRAAARRTVSIIALLAITPAAWPLLDLASAADAALTLVLAGTSMFFGVLAVTLARRALEESEQSRIAMFRRVPVGLFRAAPDGRLLDANPAMLEILGHEAEYELANLSLPELYADPREGRKYLEGLSVGGAARRFAVQMMRSDGSAIWVRGVVQAVADLDGTVRYIEGTIEDITQRREAEQASERHEQRFRTLFDSAPIGLFEQDFSFAAERLAELRAIGVSDLAAHFERDPREFSELVRRVHVIDVNAAGVELLGATTKQEAIELIRRADGLRPVFAAQLHAIWEGRERSDVEARVARADGIDQYFHVHSAMPRIDGTLEPSRMIVAVANVTPLKAAERGLAELVRSKDELVASVSHELRTPITTIMGLSLELRDNASMLSDEERSEFVGLIADQSRELSNIVEDLLVAARVDQDRLVINAEVVDLASEVPRIVASTTTRKQATIAVPEGSVAWADPLRFRQILRNLLTNADRYGGETIGVRVENDAGRARVLVCDDGAGVAAHEREAIFEPYHRAQEAGLPGAIGLGLPVSRRLARLMGGDLVYAHADGETIFEIGLPLPE